MDNQSIYANEEPESWTERSGLLEQERALIEKYIRDRGSLVEAGTGGGRIVLEIGKRFSHLDLVTFDFVEELIREARRKSDSLVSEERMGDVLKESHRILKKGGVALFSFLYYPGRRINVPLSLAVNTVRWLRGEEWKRQRLPWLKLGGRINWRLLGKNQPTTYWFEEEEIRGILEGAGFEILEIRKDNMLYIVCRK